MVHQQLPFSSLISTRYRKIEIQFIFRRTYVLLIPNNHQFSISCNFSQIIEPLVSMYVLRYHVFLRYIIPVNGSQNQVRKVNVDHQGFVVGNDIVTYVTVFFINN